MSLSKMLKQKLEADGLNVTQACEKAGLSFPSFKAVLDERSMPNSRSLGKYASFLGVSEDEVSKALEQSGATRGGKKRGRPPGKSTGTAKKKAGRPPGSGKKLGRPPGSGKKLGRPPGSGKKLGRPPGSGKKRGRPPGSGKGGDIGAALQRISAAVTQAGTVLADALAMRVHNLAKAQRARVEAVLALLG